MNWITKGQSLLLQAALLPGSEALVAWQQWRSLVDIERLDSNSHHLLCLLYRNLLRHQVEDREMTRLKGVYRRTWYANQLLLKALKTVLQHFQEAGLEALVLQDAAWVTTYYQDCGDRPIYTLEVLMRSGDISSAIRLLERQGWTPNSRDISPWHPITFHNAAQQILRVYNTIFHAPPQDHTNQQLWQQTSNSQLGLPIQILSPTDALLSICWFANQRRNIHQVPWLADAMTILQRIEEELDWVHLVTQAQRYESILPLKNILILLQEILHYSPPDWVLPSLRRMPVSHFELLHYPILPDNRMLLLKGAILRSLHRLANLKQSIQPSKTTPILSQSPSSLI